MKLIKAFEETGWINNPDTDKMLALQGNSHKNKVQNILTLGEEMFLLILHAKNLSCLNMSYQLKLVEEFDCYVHTEFISN